MASDQDSLLALEGLMTEFFGPQTTNERKRSIEELLHNFSQQKESWKHCLFFMMNTSNQYVMMYCMTVLENLINRQWIGLEAPDKMEIRSQLNRFLLAQHDRAPSYIRNKLVKLVVDIGRLDWPHFYPDFFSSILQLCQQQNTVTLGLVLLQTTSEELACPREDLSVSRKEELQRLLLAQVPSVLNLLNNILSSTVEKHRSMVTATPPPSPTHGQVDDSGSPNMNQTSPIKGSIGNIMKMSNNLAQTESLPPFDNFSHHICVLGLNCLAHLFSWIPLSTTITPPLISTIFQFAAFGCEFVPNQKTGSPGSSFNEAADQQSLGVLAMCCINELLAKNCVPQEFEDFLLLMFQQTFSLLQKLTKDSTTSSSGNKLIELDENYLEKFTEFLRLFVSVHLRRFESNNLFPIMDFLALLFKYTFKQPSNEGFYSCLEIWCVFLDYLATKLDSRCISREAVLEKYKEALLFLTTQILQKLQFRFNQSQLDELDDEVIDDDSETEWQHFLCQCLETIAKIAELMPSETFRMLYQPFSENLEVYLGLEQFVVDIPQGRRLNITAENECRRLHCTLRDLSSLLQALGRLSDHFIGEQFMEQFSDAQMLFSRLVHTTAYGSKLKLYEVNCAAVNDVLKGDFIEVHAQALASVKAYTSWLAIFYVQSYNHEDEKKKCAEMITTLTSALLPHFEKQRQVPEKVIQSAAQLLYSLMTTVRPSFLLQMPEVQNLYGNISGGSLGAMPLEVQLIVYRSLSHYLLLPWPSIPDSKQEWPTRAAHHGNFIKQLTTRFVEIKDASVLSENKVLQDQVSPCIQKTLQVLSDLVQSVTQEGVIKSKQICYASLRETVEVSLVIFPVYIHQPRVTEDLLGYFLALFEGLRVQMGIQFIEQTIQTFMSMFTKEQLSATIKSESTSGYKVIEKFLKILQVVIQEPGSAFKRFLPSVISICMEQIYPIIAEFPSPDIKPTLYGLLHTLLKHNWRYFFKISVLDMMKTQSDQMENQEQFIRIMQAFGQAFLQPDIAVFRQNLEALEDLNSKLKLYHKEIFKQMMLQQFLKVLMQVLVCRSHNLLEEEIGITIYNMASVDFDGFYSTFLPQFVSECEGLDLNQKRILGANFKLDKDLPSFTQSISRFVTDLRYYQLCNSSLPAGSVQL